MHLLQRDEGQQQLFCYFRGSSKKDDITVQIVNQSRDEIAKVFEAFKNAEFAPPAIANWQERAQNFHGTALSLYYRQVYTA